jgi:hypothetical protein
MSGCDATMSSMYNGPPIADEVNPSTEEIRAWAYSGAVEPMEDWDIIIAVPRDLPLLLELVGDGGCPARQYLLGSLYCLVGHSDRSDPRLEDAIRTAEATTEPWLTTWARRFRAVKERPDAFNRQDWCGLPGYATRPIG